MNTLEYAQRSGAIYVKITNFRSIKEIELILSGNKEGNVTQLIGKNNSGKSNIMLALFMALSSSDNIHKGKRKLSNDDWNNSELDIIIEIYFEGKVYKAIAKPGADSFVWEGSKPKKPNKPKIEPVFLRAIPDSDDVTSEYATKAFGLLAKNLSDTKAYGGDIDNRIEGLLSDIAKKDNEQLGDLISNLYDNISQCDSNIEKVEYYPSSFTIDEILKKREMFVTYSGLNKAIQWNRMGHGTQRLILLSLYLEVAKYYKIKKKSDSTILLLVEEPEIFMHPQQQNAVADFVYKNSPLNTSVMLLISTHSPYFIDEKELPQLRVMRKKDGMSYLLNDGKPIDELKYEKTELVNSVLLSMRHEPEIKEVFFADIVLIVEGHHEKMFFSYLLDKKKDTKDGFSKKNVTILNSHGNGSLLAFAQVISCLEIPYVLAMDLDKDSSDEKKEESMKQYDKLKKFFDESDIISERLVTIDNDFCGGAKLKLGKKAKFKEIKIFDRIKELCDNPSGMNPMIREYVDKILNQLEKIYESLYPSKK